MSSIECPTCKTANPDANRYCGNCGSLLPSGSGLPETDIRQHIKSVLREELKDQRVVEVEVTEAIVTRLSTWSRLLAYFVGIPFALLIFALGFLGYKSFSDFSKLVKDAESKIKPTLEQAKTDAEEIKRQSENLRSVYAKLDSDATRYRQLDRQVVDLTSKVNQIAERIDFRPSTDLSEELKTKLTSTLMSYQRYMKNLGFQSRTGSVGVAIKRRSEMTEAGASYYDPKLNVIVVESSYANDPDHVLLEYTRRALFLAAGEQSAIFSVPANVAIYYGLASYFPCSFKDDPIIGRTSAAAHQDFKSWDIHNKRKLAEIQNTSRSPEVDGREIWGAVFWDVRQLLGQDTADKLIFSAWITLQSFDHNVTSTFAKKIIEKVRSLEAGKRVSEVQLIFAEHGIPL
jgi:hypothetical protein